MELRDYIYNGLIPNSYEDKKSFIQRSNQTIHFSNKLRERIKNQDNLEAIFKGDISKLKLNPFHYNACEQIYSLISIYPEIFVGTCHDLVEVWPKDKTLNQRKNALGVTEHFFVDNYPIPFYSINKIKDLEVSISRHELYHCIQRMPNLIKDFFSTDKRHHFTEEIRAYLITNALDCILEEVIEMKNKKELILTYNQSIELTEKFDIQEIRKKLYDQFNVQDIFTHSKNGLIKDFSLGSISTTISFPLLFLNPIFGALGLIYGGIKLGKGTIKISNNRRIKTSNQTMKEFMCNTREKLKEEFGIKGTNFLAYTLLWDEIEPITKTKKPIRDWLHQQKKLRCDLLLDYALSLD